jgi:glycosyltransferase involved in cell wall biosynthesis
LRIGVRASVVIPTFNRLGDLKRVVTAVLDQGVGEGDGLELVVVDDGSTDGTTQWLQAEEGRGRLRAVIQANAGPASARNRGAEAATGEVLFFLGDDTEPAQGWLLAHLEEHRVHGGGGRRLAVVGYTGFPRDHDSPFLRFINECGAQFGYALIDHPSDVPFNFFYTSNVSLERDIFLRLGGFREDFSVAAWEDIEFAYRARGEGLNLRYQPLARTVHHHRIRPRTFCRRQRTSGKAAAVFARLHPELEEFLGVHRVRGIGATAPVLREVLHAAVIVGEKIPGGLPQGLYQRYLDASYLSGLAEGLQEASHDPPQPGGASRV